MGFRHPDPEVFMSRVAHHAPCCEHTQRGYSLMSFAKRRLIAQSRIAHLHEDAVGADAGLAGVAEGGARDALGGQLHVSIVEHNEGRVAAELERHLPAQA